MLFKDTNNERTKTKIRIGLFRLEPLQPSVEQQVSQKPYPAIAKLAGEQDEAETQPLITFFNLVIIII